MNPTRGYAGDWDDYVARWKHYAAMEPTNRGRTDLAFPGDEWGSPAEWDRFTEEELRPLLPEDGSGVAVEIGPGAGKYTLRVAPHAARLVAYDVSEKFLEIARERLKSEVPNRPVDLVRLELQDCRELGRDLQSRGLCGEVDLFFSIDSMQHVELHTLLAYWVSAAECLRPGGHLVMTVASCASESGFERLVQEVGWCYGGARAGHQFYFLSPDIVTGCLTRLGFDLLRCDATGRDLFFAAKKARSVSIPVEPPR